MSKTIKSFFPKAETPEVDDSDLSEATLKKLTVSQLKTLLEKKGLATTGIKSALIQRLLNPPSSSTESSTATAPVSSTVDSVVATKRDRPEEEEDSDTEPESDQQPASKKTKTETQPESKPSEADDGNPFSLIKYLTEESWRVALKGEFQKPYFKQIEAFLKKEIQVDHKTIFPPLPLVFNALNSTPLPDVKVVIIGQDPYINENQAHGLCFSVQRGVSVPPSLRQMYKELERTVPGFKSPKHGCLEKWSTQGVLMLNATLTVQKGKANSHEKCGWQTFTDAIIQTLNRNRKGIIYLLWGGFAQKKGKLVSSSQNHILNAAHPSPMAGTAFSGCNCFVKCNELLESDGLTPVDWILPVN